MHKEPIIGIDLGTTNSCAAIVEDSGNVKLIPYKGGEYTIPSIFAIDDKGNELIGYEAMRYFNAGAVSSYNGALGRGALMGVNGASTGIRNTALGGQAGVEADHVTGTQVFVGNVLGLGRAPFDTEREADRARPRIEGLDCARWIACLG